MIESFNPEENSLLFLTESAKKHFTKHLNKTNSQAIYVGVEETGCSGLSYVVREIASNPINKKGKEISCEVFEIDNLKFFMAKDAISFLRGLTIDYQKSDFGLKRLVYFNPNETAKCGCGESFTIDKNFIEEDEEF